MSCSPAPDCSGYPHSCPVSAPDSDVAGIGVVWGFGATSLITVALSAPIALLSLVDFLVKRSPQVRWIAKRLHLDTDEQHQGWIDNLVHIIIGLSDQQLVTGLAILVVGFSKHCSMSSRHFWVVFDLGWFSAVTHLASLPVLYYYLHDYPRWRDLRVALMLCNFGFLIAAAILTFGNYDPKSHDCPIQCSFDRYQTSDFPVSATVLHIPQMVFVTLGFIWALVHMYAPDEVWRIRHAMIVDRGFNTDALDFRQFFDNQKRHLSMISTHTAATDILNDAIHFRHVRRSYYSLISDFHREHEDSKVWLTCRWILLIVFAPPTAVIWANLAVMWGMGAARLLDDRRWSVGEENQWGFGQVLPLLLLVLPFFTVTEVAQEFLRKKRLSIPVTPSNKHDFDTNATTNATTKIDQQKKGHTASTELSNISLENFPLRPVRAATSPAASSTARFSPTGIRKSPAENPSGSRIFIQDPPIASPGSPFSPMHMQSTTPSRYAPVPSDEPTADTHLLEANQDGSIGAGTSERQFV